MDFSRPLSIFIGSFIGADIIAGVVCGGMLNKSTLAFAAVIGASNAVTVEVLSRVLGEQGWYQNWSWAVNTLGATALSSAMIAMFNLKKSIAFWRLAIVALTANAVGAASAGVFGQAWSSTTGMVSGTLAKAEED